MNIIAVMGSPNKNGNTATLLSHYLAGVVKKYKDAKIDDIILNELHIETCQACNACKIAEDHLCKIKDDMTKLYDKVLAADVIILASPIYWWNMTAQMKTFIDRLYALDFAKDALKGKKLVFLTTYGGPEYESSGAGIVEQSLTSMANFTGMDFVHKFGVSSASAKITPVSKNKKALDEAEKLGESL
jgi:multimeric flavodoxin WrbA